MTYNTIDYKYLEVASKILTQGHVRDTRNGKTKSLPFQTLEFNIENNFPLLKSRKICIQPKCLSRFEISQSL